MIDPVQSRGFTLVEMLTAMAVLSLLFVILSQVVALTEQAINLNSKRLDAAGQARLAFDRLDIDLGSRPVRTDLISQFIKNKGNDNFQFYSQVDGYGGTRHLSALGYRIQQVATGRIFQLERGAAGTDWVAGSNPVAQFNLPTFSAPADSDYDVLASGIFRLEFCYLLNSGALSNGPPKDDWSDVAAIVIGVAVLDGASRQLLSDPEKQMKTLSDLLLDPIEGADPISTWDGNLSTAQYATAGVPALVVKNIRLYQRTFRVP